MTSKPSFLAPCPDIIFYVTCLEVSEVFVTYVSFLSPQPLQETRHDSEARHVSVPVISLVRQSITCSQSYVFVVCMLSNHFPIKKSHSTNSGNNHVDQGLTKHKSQLIRQEHSKPMREAMQQLLYCSMTVTKGGSGNGHLAQDGLFACGGTSSRWST